MTLPTAPVTVSIHAPRERSDAFIVPVGDATLFQSTLPVRGATRSSQHPRRHQNVSIHAPRERSDTHTSANVP